MLDHFSEYLYCFCPANCIQFKPLTFYLTSLLLLDIPPPPPRNLCCFLFIWYGILWLDTASWIKEAAALQLIWRAGFQNMKHDKRMPLDRWGVKNWHNLSSPSMEMKIDNYTGEAMWNTDSRVHVNLKNMRSLCSKWTLQILLFKIWRSHRIRS